MVDLRRAVYSKDFEYNNIDGTKEVIKLLPLKGSYLAGLFKLSKKFKELKNTDTLSEEERSDQTLALMDKETVDILVDICTATIHRSVPGASESEIDDFVAQHLFELFPVVVELNLGNIKAK
jgi:hypothetical protein